jgi:hypothetical protein
MQSRTTKAILPEYALRTGPVSGQDVPAIDDQYFFHKKPG